MKIKGNEYPILFSLNVAEAIQKRYGGVEKIADKLNDIAEIKWILTLIINEGIDYCNYMKIYDETLKRRNITEKELGYLLSLKDLHSGELGQIIIKAFNESMNVEEVEEGQEKND